MNRRHTDRMPSPYFRAVIYALAILMGWLAAIFFNVAEAATIDRAPVIERTGNDGVRKQIAWFHYERKPGRVVLYCAPEGDTTISCAVYVITDKGNAVVIITGIVATEIRS